MMLDPHERMLLLESLRPPEGYGLDVAIGTTYTLDLLALLHAPLAFTFQEWEDAEGRPTTDPLAFLEAVRRHSRRIHLFCNAGGLYVPRMNQWLDTWVEESVIEVRAPRGGIFHPKVWVLRYVAEGQVVRYRFLCLTRNLTFDRSWDTALVFEGALRERRTRIRRSVPLAEFIGALPGMALRRMSERVAGEVQRVVAELPRVDWEMPPDVDDCVFWPLGLAQKTASPFDERIRRLLVCAPFLSASALEKLAEDSEEPGILISRDESIAVLPEDVLRRYSRVFTLRPEADGEDARDEASEAVEGGIEPGVASTLDGLHAKLFLIDDGRNASVLTGSANATQAALEKNVEFLVELRGTKSRLGIEALLEPGDGKDAPVGFRELLVEWVPGTLAERRTELLERRSEELRLERLQHAIATLELAVLVRPVANGAGGEALWDLVVEGPTGWSLPESGCEVLCWPSRLPPERAVVVREGGVELAAFPHLSMDALTPFIAFELRPTGADRDRWKRFALNLPAEGFPAERQSRVLHKLLSDRNQVLRLLWMLLRREKVDVAEIAQTGEGSDRWRREELFPLLEALLESFARDRSGLEEVERLVDDLTRTPEGASLLPEGFLEVWGPIRAARGAG